MLNMNNISDKQKMMNYYRTSDMLNLLSFFPQLSPVTELVIVENTKDYLDNKSFLDSFNQNRVDTLKGRVPILGIENSGESNDFYNTLLKVKEKDPHGVLVLFKIDSEPTERYERFAGISIGVDLGERVVIEAVSKGFDGREVSKSICTHERYVIPWYDLRKISIENFKNYQTYRINNSDYILTRNERINFLSSIGLDSNVFAKFIPENYESIPNFIWLYIIKNLLKKLEENEDILVNNGIINFAISGHTEGTKFAPWGMFDKSRYTLVEKQFVKTKCLKNRNYDII